LGLGLGLGSGSGSGLGLGFPTPSPALTLIYPHPHPRPDPVPNQVRGGVFLICFGKEHPAPGASGTPNPIYSSMSGRVRADAMSLMHAYRECAVSFAVLDDQCVMRGSFLTDYVHFFRSFDLSFREPSTAVSHHFHHSSFSPLHRRSIPSPPAPCVVSID